MYLQRKDNFFKLIVNFDFKTVEKNRTTVVDTSEKSISKEQPNTEGKEVVKDFSRKVEKVSNTKIPTRGRVFCNIWL